MHKLKTYLYEPKSKIGWVHGLSACFFAILCAYFTMMIFTSAYYGDYVHRIVPSIILTPILISVYGLYFLFNQTLMDALKKYVLTLLVLLIVFFISLKAL